MLLRIIGTSGRKMGDPDKQNSWIIYENGWMWILCTCKHRWTAHWIHGIANIQPSTHIHIHVYLPFSYMSTFDMIYEDNYLPIATLLAKCLSISFFKKKFLPKSWTHGWVEGYSHGREKGCSFRPCSLPVCDSHGSIRLPKPLSPYLSSLTCKAAVVTVS